MTRSSRHKSHRQSKHSSRDAKEHSDLEEDVKMKDRNIKEEGSVRVSRDSGSSEKRKKKEENVDSVVEKEESKSSGRVESKRKSEKDSGRKEVQQYKDPSEWKDKECGSEKERKVQDSKGETEARAIGSELAKKQGSHSVDFGEEKQGKRGREKNGKVTNCCVFARYCWHVSSTLLV